MKFNITRNFLIKIILLIISVLFIIFIVVYWDNIIDIIYPFVLSIFIAYLLNPIVCKMEHKGIKRTYGILIIYVLLVIFAVFTCFYIIPVLVRDTGKLIGVLPEYNVKFRATVEYLQDKWSETGLPIGIKNVIDNNINRIQNSIALYLETFISTIIDYISKLVSYILIPILLFYFLKDYKLIVNKSKLLIPRKYRSQTIRICSNIDDIFGSYVRSQIILSIIIAVMISTALLILKVDFALIIGLLNAVTNIIPYFGPIIGTIPAVIVALLQSPAKALYTLIVMTVIQQIESDIIAPKITADCVGLYPVTVILALIIGGRLFGITGLILAVPVAAALKIIYRDVMKNMF